MAKQKTKLNPKLGKYFLITLIIVMPITMLFIVGGAVGGGLGALITLGIVWLIAKRKGIQMYIPIEEKIKS